MSQNKKKKNDKFATVKTEKYIVFHIKDENYGIPVKNVQSIERIQTITRVPGVPDYIKGVINLRGIITPVIDVRRRFDIDSIDLTDDSRIIIVSIDGSEIGLIVDEANDVLDIPLDSIEPAPDTIGDLSDEQLDGVANLESKIVILLNIKHVLDAEEINDAIRALHH